MNNKKPHQFLFAWMLFLFAACNFTTQELQEQLPTKKQGEKLMELKYAVAGGEMGYSMSFWVRQDSTIYSLKNDMNAKGTKIVSEKTDNTFWQNLITGIDLDKVAEIKNGESRQPYDGMDTWLNIKTNIRTIAFVNGDSDTLHYPGVKFLMDKIFNALSKYQATGQ